jgi:hypothetical protein
MAFLEKLTEGKAYIAPSTSLHLMLVISLKNLLTSFARYFSELNRAAYSASNLVFVASLAPYRGFTIRSTINCPTELEHRFIDLSFTSCSYTAGLKLCRYV